MTAWRGTGAREGEARPRLTRREFLVASGAGAMGATLARPRPTDAQQPKRGGTLRHVAHQEPPTFDIHGTVSFLTQLVSSFCRRTLAKFAMGPKSGPSDFTLVPDLAERWEMSQDGRIYTFHLRRGVRWERKAPVNGRELVAADVKYSLERAAKKSGYASLLGKIEAVETPDKYSVRVHLADAFAPFLHNTAEPWLAILPKEVEDKFGDFKAAETLIGCGPFVLDRHEPGVRLVFARNPDYYQTGLPYLDRVEWVYVKDKATQLSLFRAGQVDIPFYDARIGRSDVPSIKQTNPTYPIVNWDWLAVRTLAVRVDKPPFGDVRVRRAMSLALDRKKWVDSILEGQGWTDPGPVPAPMAEWKLPTAELGPGARWLEYNPAEAKRLLAQAGYPQGFKAKVTHWPGYGPEYVEDLELLVFALKQIGVELEIVNEEYGKYIAGSFLGKYDDTTWGPSSLFTEVDSYLYNFYRTGQPNNRSHVSDTQLDVMLDAQRRYLARSSRKKVIDEIQRYCADQVYYVYTPYPKNLASWNPRVRSYAPKNSFDRGAQLEAVWIE